MEDKKHTWLDSCRDGQPDKEDNLNELPEGFIQTYTIEEIEKAIDLSVLENYQIEILKREIISNLKK